MLVLTRQKNESIKVGDNIYIMVCEIRGDRVRLGIEAPASVPVYRMELLKDQTDDDSADYGD